MAVITINGNTSLNPTAAPDAYVNVLSPQPSGATNVSATIGALVGSGGWSEPNTPIPVSTSAGAIAAFGPMTLAAHDLVTDLQQATAFSNNLLAVRVTDGTDTAATVQIKDSGATVVGITVTAKYTGSVGNTISVSIAAGSLSVASAPTATVTVQRAGYPGEVFANLPNSATGSLWPALVNALNNGVSGQRGPSQLVVGTIGASVLGAAFATSTLAGGTNGDTNVTSADQIGLDGTSGRTGMYALRSTGAAVFGLCGNTDSTVYATQQTFGESEGMLAILGCPASMPTATLVTTKQTANLVGDWAKVVKDFITFYDATNAQQRSIAPIGEAVGFRAGLNPWDSTLNKPSGGIQNIISTVATSTPYSEAEIGVMLAAGIDTICNPIPAANVYGFRTGVVASGKDDNYPIFTSYLARSFASVMGPFVGNLQSSQVGDQTRARARAALHNFMSTINAQIDSYDLTLDHTNNTPTTVGEGYLIGAINVRYLGVIRQFLLNFQGGSTVSVTVNSPLA